MSIGSKPQKIPCECEAESLLKACHQSFESDPLLAASLDVGNLSKGGKMRFDEEVG